MTQTFYPFDSINTSEAQYSQLFKRLQSTGVSGTPAGTELKVYADSSGMAVKVPAGFAVIRGHAYNSDAEETLTIGAASSSPRNDLICLKLDPTANSITLIVKAGTPAATPSDPSLTQTEEGVYEFPIARVVVPANAVTISAGNVTDIRQFIGTQVRVWTSATRPNSPVIPTVGWNTTTQALEVFNGSVFKTIGLADDAISASRMSSGEQANLIAGKVRNGSTVSGTPIAFHVLATAPTPVAGMLNLWFWGE